MSINSLSNTENIQKFNIGDANNSPRFKAKPNWGKINEQVSKDMKKVSKALVYLGENNGENLNTVVTAVGTSVVAPIFIAGNPFSKEDKETKWYSAMRQPISAIIAVITQLYVNSKYKQWLDKIASTGGFGKLVDLRAMPANSYLKRIAKLQHPDYDKKQIKSLVEQMKKDAEKSFIRQTRKEMANKQIDIKDLISKEDLDAAEKILKKKVKETFKSEKNDRQRTNIFKRKIKPEMIEQKALENINEALKIEAHSKFKIRQLKDSGISIDEAIKQMSAKKPKTKAGKEILENVLNKLTSIKEYEAAHNIESFKSVKDIGKTYTEIMHNVKVKKLVKIRVSDAAKRFKKFTNWTGLVVALATLPFSCGLLNWAYPRIMEKVMPKLQPWIHRNDKDWKPEETNEKFSKKNDVEVEEDEEDDD